MFNSFRTTFFLLIVSLFIGCDDSGNVEYEHLGLWYKLGDSIIYNDSREFEPETDKMSLEFFDNYTYQSLNLNLSGDTTYLYTGKWSLSRAKLSIYYEVGPRQVYDLRVQDDVLGLIQNGYYYKVVEVFNR